MTVTKLRTSNTSVCFVACVSFLKIYFSRLPLTLAFTPNCEKLLNFNLVCKVKMKQQALRLNVKAEGYSVKCSVYYEHYAGQKVELSEHNLSMIDLGEVGI